MPALHKKTSKRKRAYGSEAQFPGKLHDMMTYVEQNGLESIICWVVNGRAFKINDPDDLVNLLPLFFGQTKYRSFRRQLNMWHFDRIQDGPNRGAFMHPYFVRGNKELCGLMSRQVFVKPREDMTFMKNNNRIQSPSYHDTDADTDTDTDTDGATTTVGGLSRSWKVEPDMIGSRGCDQSTPSQQRRRKSLLLLSSSLPSPSSPSPSSPGAFEAGMSWNGYLKSSYQTVMDESLMMPVVDHKSAMDGLNTVVSSVVPNSALMQYSSILKDLLLDCDFDDVFD